MVLQEMVAVSKSVGTIEQNEKKGLSSNGKSTSTAPVARSYQPPVSYPQRLACTKLSKLDPRFTRFLDILKRVYIDTPFLEALRAAPTSLKFLRELLSKKGEHKRPSVAPIGEVVSALLQRGSPEKLQDPDSFSIPCCIGKFQIKRALYDLGASMSIMHLSICKKFKLPDLRPITLVI